MIMVKKPKNIRKILLPMVVLAFVLVSSSPLYAIIGTGRICYNSSLSEGLTTPIDNILYMEDYDSTIISDPTVSSMIYYLNNRNIVFHHTHGSPGLFVCSNGNITTTTINNSFSSGELANARLIYVSSCQTGRYRTPYGDLVAKLRNKGALCVIAFKENVSASTDYDGIHYFNNLVFAYARSYSYIYDAIEEATIVYYNSYSWDCGLSSVRYSGNFSFLS